MIINLSYNQTKSWLPISQRIQSINSTTTHVRKKQFLNHSNKLSLVEVYLGKGTAELGKHKLHDRIISNTNAYKGTVRTQAGISSTDYDLEFPP